ncbi:MAG: hypothetical protein ACK4WB_00590 [Desulfatiglandales bacterium]
MDDISQKILRAKGVYHSLELPPEVKEASTELSKAIARKAEILKALGLSEICKRCDIEEGGSCCGRGIENYYDEPLLLLNCILGVSLHVRRREKDSCLFLGTHGCILRARHTLCVNYLCEKILNRFSPYSLMELKEAEGRELEYTFRLCERLRRYFQ